MNPKWFAIPATYLDLNPSRSNEEKGDELGLGNGKGLPEIPLDQMWPDDELWMPLLLKGQYFVGRVDFGIADDEKRKGSWVMERWWFGTRDLVR